MTREVLRVPLEFCLSGNVVSDRGHETRDSQTKLTLGLSNKIVQRALGYPHHIAVGEGMDQGNGATSIANLWQRRR